MSADEEIYYTDADGNCENCGGEGEIMQLDGSVHACYSCRLQAARIDSAQVPAETDAIRDARSLAVGFRASGNVLVAQIIENCISEAAALRAARDDARAYRDAQKDEIKRLKRAHTATMLAHDSLVLERDEAIDDLKAVRDDAARVVALLEARTMERDALSVALPSPRVILMLSSAVSHHPTLMADERGDCMAALHDLHKAYNRAKGNARVHSTFDKEPSR